MRQITAVSRYLLSSLSLSLLLRPGDLVKEAVTEVTGCWISCEVLHLRREIYFPFDAVTDEPSLISAHPEVRDSLVAREICLLYGGQFFLVLPAYAPRVDAKREAPGVRALDCLLIEVLFDCALIFRPVRPLEQMAQFAEHQVSMEFTKQFRRSISTTSNESSRLIRLYSYLNPGADPRPCNALKDADRISFELFPSSAQLGKIVHELFKSELFDKNFDDLLFDC